MKEAKSTKGYIMRQLGTKERQLFQFRFTPRSVTGTELQWFGKDELTIMKILIMRTFYLYNIRPCQETADAIAFLEIARYELETLTEELTKKKASTFFIEERVKGHIYHIGSLRGEGSRTITFLRRSSGYITYEDEWPGVQSQEVIRMLIARVKHLARYVDKQSFEWVIWALRMSLTCYEIRARRRKEAKVNGRSGDHDDTARVKPWREVLLCLSREIEKVRTGDDGHIISP